MTEFEKEMERIGDVVEEVLVNNVGLDFFRGGSRRVGYHDPTSDLDIIVEVNPGFAMILHRELSKKLEGEDVKVVVPCRGDHSDSHTYDGATLIKINDQVHVVAQMPIQDINAATDIPDFPTEWMNCLIWNLADQMSLEYTIPASMRQEIALRAKAYRDQLTDWDTEVASTFFVPDNRFGMQRNGNTV